MTQLSIHKQKLNPGGLFVVQQFKPPIVRQETYFKAPVCVVTIFLVS